MNIKYKKVILITVMSTMGIGLLTLSLGNDRTQAQSGQNKSAVKDADTMAVSQVVQEAAAVVTVTPEVTATATPIPSPTPLPVYKIEEDTNPEITQLFKDYYKSESKLDMDTFRSLHIDPSQVESKEKLKEKTQFIEGYSNIKTYVKKGFKEGTFIVYVYHEIKFMGIDTPGPGLSKSYVVTDADHKLKIFSGNMDETTKAYFDARNDDEDVKALIKMTDDKTDKAIEKDENLKKLMESIKKLMNEKGAAKS